MKRALSILGVVGVTALVTYLAVTKHLAQERAAHLDRALMDAEARVMQLEEQIETAQQRIAYLTRPLVTTPSPAPALRLAPMDTGAMTSAVPGSAAREVVAVAPASAVTASTQAGTALPMPAGGFGALPFCYSTSTAAGLTNLVRIEGTSSVHDWQVQGTLIGGSAEFGAGFPSQPGIPLRPGPVEAKANVFIPVRSLKSVERTGKPYSDQMDEIMYGKLRALEFNRISFTLTSLRLKELPPAATAPFVYEATGALTVAGQTNTVTMPVTVVPTPSGNVQLSGSVRVKMSDFNISPPAPVFGSGAITTGDEVTLRFVWGLKPRESLKAAK